MKGERRSRAIWTTVTEPGDPVAGELISWAGAVPALAWLKSVKRERVDWSYLDGDLSVPVKARLIERGRLWARRLDRSEMIIDSGYGAGLRVLVPGDPGWPPGLSDLGATVPHALWIKGQPQALPSAALVGARACSAYGQRVAGDLADGLVGRGITVVSGGAYGIDAAAHRAALASGGNTWAVLAGGLDRVYPVGHATLFEEIVDTGGVLLGESPPGAVPARGRFLQRNRLIAALAGTTVVIEAAWRSGALSTAHHAARLLRPVGAVPGPITSVVSAGCHRLLRESIAVCVTDADEIVELLGPIGAAIAERETGELSPLDAVGAAVQAVHDGLSTRRARTVDELVTITGQSVDEVRASLGRLDVAGLAIRDGERWRAVPVRRVTHPTMAHSGHPNGAAGIRSIDPKSG